MRRVVLVVCVYAMMVGCDLFVDTSGLSGESEVSASDAGAETTGSEAGGPDAVGNDGALDAETGAKALRVFVTDATWTGSLGGLSGADGKCNAAASAQGLGGTWAAWLSAQPMSARDRITSAGPWKLLTGELAVTRDDLGSPPIEHAIDRNESSKQVVDTGDVWTGTGADGNATGSDCQGWTSTSGSGTVGDPVSTNGAWTSSGAQPCTETHRLYCFEL